MTNNFTPNRVEQLIIDFYKYLELLGCRAKLSSVEQLSRICSSAISVAIAAFFVGTAFVLLVVLATIALYDLLHSILWALAIMIAANLIIGLMFYATRGKMFVGSMIKIFAEDNLDQLRERRADLDNKIKSTEQRLLHDYHHTVKVFSPDYICQNIAATATRLMDIAAQIADTARGIIENFKRYFTKS